MRVGFFCFRCCAGSEKEHRFNNASICVQSARDRLQTNPKLLNYKCTSYVYVMTVSRWYNWHAFLEMVFKEIIRKCSWLCWSPCRGARRTAEEDLRIKKQAQAFAPNINIFQLKYCVNKPGSMSSLNKKLWGTVQVITGIQSVGGWKVSLVMGLSNITSRLSGQNWLFCCNKEGFLLRDSRYCIINM